MPLLCRDANVNACSIMLVTMVMRGEIRPVQMRKDDQTLRGDLPKLCTRLFPSTTCIILSDLSRPDRY